MLVARLNRAAEHRQQAQEARVVAAWISLKDVREQLLATARDLEALADEEERLVQEVSPAQASIQPPIA